MKNKKINFAFIGFLAFVFGILFISCYSKQIKAAEEGYMHRSNDVCTNGRIFAGTTDFEIGDNVYVSYSSVLKPDDDLPHPFQMWYAGHDGATWRIYAAYSDSTDASTWHKINNKKPADSAENGTDGRIPLSPLVAEVASDNVEVMGPSILRERLVLCMGEKEIPNYKLWYTGYDQEFATWRIYGAKSIDGLSWNKDKIQLFETTCSDEVCSKQNLGKCCYGATEKKEDGGLSIKFVKVDKCADTSIRDSNVVLDIKKKCVGDCESACCVETDRTYHMWYSGEEGHLGGCPKSEDFHASRIYYATSKAGEKSGWEKHGVVLDFLPDGYENIRVLEPTVILEKKYVPSCCDKPDPVKGIIESRCEEIDKTFHMWYTGYGKNDDNKEYAKIYYATSKDGKNWDRKGIAIDLGEYKYGIGDKVYAANPTVISDTPLALSSHNGPPFRMWYSGFDGATWLIYEATSKDGLHWTKVDNSIPGGGTPPPEEKSECKNCTSKSKDDCTDKCSWSKSESGEEKCVAKAEECKEELKCEICQNYDGIKDECDKVDKYCAYNTENKKCEKKPSECNSPADRCQNCEKLSAQDCENKEKGGGEGYCKLNTATNKCEKGEKCANPVNGLCKESNFEGKCSWDPKIMSCICQGESAGNPTRDSGVDLCKSDKTPFSVGLLQINLTCQYNNSKIPACKTALDPDKHGCANSNCHLENLNSYNQCKEYFYNADNNISAGCTLFKEGGYKRWGAYKDAKCDSL